MVVTHKEVGPKRYRETYGRYLEDFEVGDVYEHRPGRTITEYDNVAYTLLTMNTHPLHFDNAYAEVGIRTAVISQSQVNRSSIAH